MKTSALILFISAAFLLTSIRCDPCSDAYNFADMTMSSLKTNFFNNQFENMYEDFGNVMKSAELIQESCSDDLVFAIDANRLSSCSLAYSALSELLQDFGMESEEEMVLKLSQVMSLIPTIEGKFCVEEWEKTTQENQQGFIDDIWYQPSDDDYTDYDMTDNFIIEDEEEEDTGDEIYGNSDEDDIESEVPEVEEKAITIDWSEIQQDDDSDDEVDEEEEDDIDSEDTIMVYVQMPEMGESIAVNDDELEAAIFVESEDHEAMSFIGMPEAMEEDEDKDMVMVFVQMTNMKDIENELELEVGEEDVSTEAEMSGELFFEDDDEYNSIFVFVNIDTAAGVDQAVNAMFAAEDDDDIDMSFGELDMQQYWDDEEDDSEYDD